MAAADVHSPHAAPPPALRHSTISQHTAQQVYVVKTRKKYRYAQQRRQCNDDAVAGNDACSCCGPSPAIPMQ